MSTTSTSTAFSVPRGTRARRGAAVGGAALATLAIWALARLAGVHLAVALGKDASVQQIGPAVVVFATVLAGLAGWGLLAALERWTARAWVAWRMIALVVLALSLVGPLTGGRTAAATAALVGMHLAAAAVLIPALARSVSDR